MTAYLSVLVCLIGLVIYLVSGNPPDSRPIGGKIATIGLNMFWCGLLAFLLINGDPIVEVLKTRGR